MPKISFNAAALGIAEYCSDCDVSHAETFRAPAALMVRNPVVQAALERVGFPNIQSLHHPSRGGTAEDVDS